MMQLLPWLVFGAAFLSLCGVGGLLAYHFWLYSKNTYVTAITLAVYSMGSLVLTIMLAVTLL